MDKSNIRQLQEYLKKNKAKNYPIANKELENSTDYIKNGYLKMLAVVMQQAEDISEAQQILFKRMIEGAKTEKSAEDYLRMALEIEVEDYVRFTTECKDFPLKYRWLLDAIVIICVNEKNEEQSMLIAEFCESLAISKEEVQYIAALAKAIVTMDGKGYVDAVETKAEQVPDAIFSDYIDLLGKDCVYSNEHMTIFQPSKPEDVTVQLLEKIVKSETPVVKIIGAKISLEYFDLKFEYEEKEKIVFEECHFIGGENAISFQHVDYIIFKNCKFTDFKSRTITINDNTNTSLVLLDGCEFTNCKYEYYDHAAVFRLLGGVIYSYNSDSVARLEIKNSLFTGCGEVNSSWVQGTAFISNIDCYVDHCKFVDCWYLCHGTDIDREKTMFTKDSVASNCSFENSASFN